MLSSGMCLITKRLLFLGSRVGDSLLVSLKKKEAAGAAQMLPAAAPKKRKAGEAEPPKPPPPPTKVATDQDDEDELAWHHGEDEEGAPTRIVLVPRFRRLRLRGLVGVASLDPAARRWRFLHTLQTCPRPTPCWGSCRRA